MTDPKEQEVEDSSLEPDYEVEGPDIEIVTEGAEDNYEKR